MGRKLHKQFGNHIYSMQLLSESFPNPFKPDRQKREGERERHLGQYAFGSNNLLFVSGSWNFHVWQPN